jgi:DeoR family fructose operon transcriptional repressor
LSETSTNADGIGTTTHPRPIFPEQRQQAILQILQREQFVKVGQLSALLGTSDASVRRDLQALEEAGLLKRTHGGAVCSQPAGFEPSLAEKQDRFLPEKAAIARAAVELVQSGETVLLDAGSTTLHVAALLKYRQGITVVTNAVNIARELAAGDLEVTLTGGTLRSNTLAMVGPIAENTLAGLHVDKLFLATNGLDLKRGLTTPNLSEAQVKRHDRKRARGHPGSRSQQVREGVVFAILRARPGRLPDHGRGRAGGIPAGTGAAEHQRCGGAVLRACRRSG